MKAVRIVRILNAEQTGYADGLDGKCEGKRGVKDDCMHFGLENGRMDFASTEVKKTLEIADWVVSSGIWFWTC